MSATRSRRSDGRKTPSENYHMAVALRPDYAEAYNNYGDALQELGRLEEAFALLPACDRASAGLTPRPTTIWAARSASWGGRRTRSKAISRRSSSSRRIPSTQANLAGLYISKLDDPGLAIAESNKGLELLRRSTFGAACDEAAIATLMKSGIPFFRLKHDVQQADYLAAKGHAVAGLDAFRQAGRALLDRNGSAAESADDASPTIHPTATRRRRCFPIFRRATRSICRRSPAAP